MRGFRGYYRKILVVVRLLCGCCKTGEQVSGCNHKARAHITATAPARARALLPAPRLSWGQLQRGLLWARWVLGRTFLEWVCDGRGDLITLTHRGERGL